AVPAPRGPARPSRAPPPGAAPPPPSPTPRPGPRASARARASATAGASSSGSPRASSLTYVVQRGDILSAIAARYGVTVQAIVAANGLADPNHIEPGQRLIIPLP
ncbi:MAG: LysM peptidoglycan-binding domain-containing protein, partial [Candidatus Limnocylindrales bacterium]